MNLSKTERAFLGLATLDASIPFPEIARKLGTSISKLRYAVQSLQAKGILRVAPVIDRTLLGMTDFHIVFSISASSEDRRVRFLNSFSKANGVIFLAELGGNFQYEAIISCRSALEASTILDQAATKSQINIRGKSVSTNVSMSLFTKRYLTTTNTRQLTKVLPLVGATPRKLDITIDTIDSKLLTHISIDGNMSLRALGEQCGISHATVQYRIDRLKKHGVLRGTYYDVEPLQYGYHDFVWQLSVSHNRTSMEEKLLDVANSSPFVSYLATFFGEWDFELGVEVPEPRLINQVIQKLSEDLGPEFSMVRLLMRFGQLTLHHYPRSVGLAGSLELTYGRAR